MTDMTTAWTAWAAFHHDHGFMIEHHLNPPADMAAIAAFDTEIGFGIPVDLRDLWSIADGQVDSFSIKDPSPGTTVSPVFGSYEFMSAAASLDAYRGWMDTIREFGATDDMITVRADDPVHASYWRRGWIPFAIDGGGNYYAVDMDPAPEGTRGQVILAGPDEDERRVLGTGIAAWLLETAKRRPEMNDDAEMPLQYFDMEPLGRREI